MPLFGNAQLRKIVDETIVPNVPVGHNLALVASTDTLGYQIVGIFKRDTELGTWQLMAAARHDHSGDNSAGAFVMFSRP